jgi:16S rRNA (guanine527-N7)-methyltransferase
VEQRPTAEPSQPQEPPAPPVQATGVFGTELERATRYVGWLATAGVVRGLLGPREVPRLWERHVLNAAVVAELIPAGAVTLCDVGSGAGLPGIPLALCRPDLTVTLLEPLQRRATFLAEVVADLGLDNVEVRRGRAEDTHDTYAVVTARAVAPLPKLLGWTLPLVATGGLLLAMKGDAAESEITQSREVLRRHGSPGVSVQSVGIGTVEPVTRVVVVGPVSGRRRPPVSGTGPVGRPGRGRSVRST